MTIFSKSWGAALVLALTMGAATAQDDSEGERPAEEREAVLKLLDSVLPEWDERILRQPEAKDWTAELNLTGAVRALGDRDLLRALREAPNGAQLVQTDAAALRVDPAQGYVRYANRKRIVDLSDRIGPLPEPEKVMELGMAMLQRLGLPLEEFATPQVQTQMAAGGSTQSERPERVDEVYRLFVAQRVVNGLPVLGSMAVIAVTENAEVQRLRTQWPSFRMNRGDKLLERRAVLEQAADALIDHGITGEAPLLATLGYAPEGLEAGGAYLPVVTISATIEPTPILMSVPLVQPGDADEP